MRIDEAVASTEERLAEEGGTMGDLLGHFRDRISPVLVGDPEWEHILECAGNLPVTMAALPFGFELPLHTHRPEADFGVSLASGTRPAAYFRERAQADEAAAAVTRLFGQIDAENSSLREIVGRKLMLEYDIGSAGGGNPLPGMFLIPRERPIVGARGQEQDAGTVVEALVSCVGWESSDAGRESVKRVYLAQPEDTRMESFGVFPSRSRAIRLAVMGFKSGQAICSWLEKTGWPGQVPAVESVIARFGKRVNIIEVGANIDVLEKSVGPTLGLTLIVRERFSKKSEYWLDGQTDWNSFLEALSHENLAISEKITALADWISKPTPLFAKSGHYLKMRGIHHIKLVISENRLRQAKAYVFMVLSGAV